MAFDFIQTKHIAAGQMWRKTFVDTVNKAVTAKPSQRRPHTFISSKPGLGKSYTTQLLLDKNKINYLPISGHPSLWNFAVQLAEIVYHLPKNQSAVIWVDDCDKIFSNENNCNVLKNMLEGHKALAYNVDVSNNISKLRNNGEEYLAEILESFKSKNGLGINIDCSNLVFIFTSNIFLPDADQVTAAEGRKGYNQIVGQHALRDRCKTKDLVMEWQDHWGWIADVVINDGVLNSIIGKNKKAQEEILKFMWNNWPKLKEKSVRTAEKLAEDYADYAPDHENHWISTYVKI